MLVFDKIHFIGIGGIGISALASWALAEGKKVTGSDASDSALIADLKTQGAKISIGHFSENVGADVELVVYTEAIDSNTNPELGRAKELGIPTLSYFQALGKISEGKKTIAVAGTHGKTTTTAMLGLALIEAGQDPTVIVGSKVREFGNRNIRIGKSDLLVVEACEYRRSFLNLSPFGVVMLNCEADHLDYYKDENDYVKAFEELAREIPEDGFLVINKNDHHLHRVAKKCVGKVVEVGVAEAEQWDMPLLVFGKFNKLNALQAFKAAELLGADAHEVRHALRKFRGTWRRMELKGEFQGAKVYDDYGHHPTEISSTLGALKAAYPNKRLVCVFQPHQHSRTYQLLEGFKGAFKSADKVIVPNIYAARDTEEDKQKIDAERFVVALQEQHPDVVWGESLDKTYALLEKLITPKDLVITMGAGNITELADQLVG